MGEIQTIRWRTHLKKTWSTMPCPAVIVSSLSKFTGNTRFEGVVYTLEGKVSEDLSRLEIGSTRTKWSSTKVIAVPHPGWRNLICQYCCKAAWQKQTLMSQWTTNGIWVSNVPASHILGGYYQQDSQQMQGSHPSLLFGAWEVTAGVLHLVLGLFRKGTDVAVSPAEVHQGSQGLKYLM